MSLRRANTRYTRLFAQMAGSSPAMTVTLRSAAGNRMDLSPDPVAIIGFVVLFALMLLRVPVGMAMGLVGVSGFGYLVGAGPALKMVGQTSMRIVTDYTFGVIPMFL